MIRLLIETAVASALYGFSVGSLHSLRLATWNLAKFPLLILLTMAVCAISYYVFAQFATRRLSFADVLRMSLRTYRDISLLLASLAPVCYFLARTVRQPDTESLHEYPFFLGLNVAFISLCGVVALVRQGRVLLRRHGIPARTSAQVILTWLALSLFAGGQCAWYLRPFYGVSTVQDVPFIARTAPDFRGARSFYEAVYYLVRPPPLPKDYYKENR